MAEVGKAKVDVVFTEPADPELLSSIERIAKSTLETIIDRGEGRGERNEGVKRAESEAIAQLSEQYDAKTVAKAFDDVLKKTVRAKVIKEGKRPDGRALTEVRPLSSEVGLLPRTHGSALFQRGETQILTVATLGRCPWCRGWTASAPRTRSVTSTTTTSRRSPRVRRAAWARAAGR